MGLQGIARKGQGFYQIKFAGITNFQITIILIGLVGVIDLLL